jgi:MoaD family protein
MRVTVRVYGELRRIAGTSQLAVDFDGKTVGELLDHLSKVWGAEFQSRLFQSGSDLRPGLVLLANGHSIRLLHGLNTGLSGLDEIEIESVEIAETVGGG